MKLNVNDQQKLKGFQKWINHSVKEFLVGNDPRDVMQDVFQDLKEHQNTSSPIVSILKANLFQELDDLQEKNLKILMAKFIYQLDEEYVVANAFLVRGGTDIQEADTVDEEASHYISKLGDVHDRVQAIPAKNLDIDAVAQQLLVISQGYRPTFEWISMSINNDVLATKQVEASEAKNSILFNLQMIWDSLHDSF